MTGALSPSHWVIILVVVLLLFGAKRLPDAARGLGKSLRIFKAETTALSAEGGEKTAATPGTPGEPTATPAQPTATPAPSTGTPVGPSVTEPGAGPELVRPAPPARDTAA